RELVGGAVDGPRARDVDARRGQAVARKLTEEIAAEAADVGRAQAEPCAHADGRRGLSARQPREALQALLGVRRRELGKDGEEIDAVEAEADDIKGFGIRGIEAKRNAHELPS